MINKGDIVRFTVDKPQRSSVKAGQELAVIDVFPNAEDRPEGRTDFVIQVTGGWVFDDPTVYELVTAPKATVVPLTEEEDRELQAHLALNESDDRPARLYIAGPMRGYEDFNYPAFHAAAKDLREQGFDVLNPAEFFDGKTDLPVETYLRFDVEQLLTIDELVVLPGWQGSHGARLEVSVARALGLVISEYGTHRRLTDTDLPIELEAATHVYGDRQAAYGHPATDFERTGRIWGAVLGIPDVPAELVALCLAGLKISREVNLPKRDNLVDLIGYAICAKRIVDAEAVPA